MWESLVQGLNTLAGNTGSIGDRTCRGSREPPRGGSATYSRLKATYTSHAQASAVPRSRPINRIHANTPLAAKGTHPIDAQVTKIGRHAL